jgi:hypothetical protein
VARRTVAKREIEIGENNRKILTGFVEVDHSCEAGGDVTERDYVVNSLVVSSLKAKETRAKGTGLSDTA